LQGVQAEAFRVPAADMNAVPIPEGVSGDQALMMTDALATAWFGARNADIRPGSAVAVIGLGPIGLMAVDSAFVMGAHVVYAIDPIAERRALAAEARSRCIPMPRWKRSARPRRGASSIAWWRWWVGRHGRSGAAAGGAPGTVSVIGVQQSRRYAFRWSAFAAGLTFRIGTCSVPEELPALFPLVQSGRLRPERYISHRMPLSQGSEAYRLFDSREAGALKMVLAPD
jgi:threonine dehydrogenase-like Zn-dependent dehydrogenase